MAFKDFPNLRQGVALLQRSLERGRLGHAYLFTGHQVDTLETLAATLAKTLNCQNPTRREGNAVDCCDRCIACQKIEHGNHADVHWVRPEMKTRIIGVEQTRDLIKEMQLKPTEADYKFGIIVCADRMNVQSANAFLKTLEEPPARSILVLLSTEPQRLLETVLSRCLRLNFGGEAFTSLPAEQRQWLVQFGDMAAGEQKSLIGRYRLMDVLLARLNQIKTNVEQTLSARSPLERYKDAEKDLTEKWEAELSAAIEAEYRRQRSDVLAFLQAWLRDVWIETEVQSPKSKAQSSKPTAHGPQSPASGPELLNFPELQATKTIAQRISPAEAMENLEIMELLQRWLYTNVQEALALEVGLLKLRL